MVSTSTEAEWKFNHVWTIKLVKIWVKLNGNSMIRDMTNGVEGNFLWNTIIFISYSFMTSFVICKVTSKRYSFCDRWTMSHNPVSNLGCQWFLFILHSDYSQWESRVMLSTRAVGHRIQRKTSALRLNFHITLSRLIWVKWRWKILFV